jgi:signal transduction histidine kinase
MASARQQGTSDEPHLGIGLYIVQLIAEFHHGRVSAHDRTDPTGVEIRVELPRLVSDPG